jgi:aspartyl aminopeptidase
MRVRNRQKNQKILIAEAHRAIIECEMVTTINKTYNEDLFSFIRKSPTAFHTAHTAAELLEKNGYCRLNGGGQWQLERRHYFTMRGESSVIAFDMPKSEAYSFKIIAAHTDFAVF